jgi:hypothetical protein
MHRFLQTIMAQKVIIFSRFTHSEQPLDAFQMVDLITALAQKKVTSISTQSAIIIPYFTGVPSKCFTTVILDSIHDGFDIRYFCCCLRPFPTQLRFLPFLVLPFLFQSHGIHFDDFRRLVWLGSMKMRMDKASVVNDTVACVVHTNKAMTFQPGVEGVKRLDSFVILPENPFDKQRPMIHFKRIPALPPCHNELKAPCRGVIQKTMELCTHDRGIGKVVSMFCGRQSQSKGQVLYDILANGLGHDAVAGDKVHGQVDAVLTDRVPVTACRVGCHGVPFHQTPSVLRASAEPATKEVGFVVASVTGTAPVDVRMTLPLEQRREIFRLVNGLDESGPIDMKPGTLIRRALKGRRLERRRDKRHGCRLRRGRRTIRRVCGASGMTGL